jgi:hypothetical protein
MPTMIISLSDERELLERMAAALAAAPDGLTYREMMAAVPELTISRCQRLLNLLEGKGLAYSKFENRTSEPTRYPRKMTIYRIRKP